MVGLPIPLCCVQESWYPWYQTSSHVGSISLLVSFGILQNARTKYITFDVVDMHYPYNAIFTRGLLNTFKAALHLAYLCLKVPDSLGVISIHGG
jgi:hypothetical protein